MRSRDLTASPRAFLSSGESASNDAQSLYTWLRRLAFDRPSVRAWAIALAVLLVLPTLATGFIFDDYALLYELGRPRGHEWTGSAPLDLFRWIDPAHFARMVDGQGVAWWTFSNTTIAFLRPVSSLTHALDHWIWPNSAFGMHLQSVLWFALLLLITAKYYGELLGDRWVVGLSTLMFALDSSHGIAVGWISNRNALVAGAFASATLLLHHRRRNGGCARVAALAALCFALSLFSAELAVGLVGYLVAYALLFETGALGPRLRSLLPYAGVCAAWLLIRKFEHYGVVGLGGYIDPVNQPFAFVTALPSRSLVLIASQLSRLSADMFEFAPERMRPLLLGSALGVFGLGLFFVWPTLRARRSSRFLAAGALLSALPLAAGEPSDRLLTLVGLGVIPVLALAIRDALSSTQVSKAPGSARGVCALWFTAVHLVLDPLLLPLLALTPSLMAAPAAKADATLPSALTLSNQVVIVTNVPDSILLTYLEMMRTVEGKSRPQKLYWLLASSSDAQFERSGPNRLRVTAKRGFFEHWEERSSSVPMHRGDRIALSEMTITVLDVTKDGRPTVCDFAFARPLESPSYLWLTWRGDGLRALALPHEGQSETLCAGCS